MVLKWSRVRKRYERQGVLVEAAALEAAEAACLADAALRQARNARRAEREAVLDQAYVAQFGAAIRRTFPACPAGRATEIAEHACRKYSGRVGRTSAAKSLDPQAIELAVRAHVRHRETEYDLLLTGGYDRGEARTRVSDEVDVVLRCWRQPS